METFWQYQSYSFYQNQRLEKEVLKSGKEVESFKTEMKKIESENKVWHSFISLSWYFNDNVVHFNILQDVFNYLSFQFWSKQELKDENKQLEIGMREILAQLRENASRGKQYTVKFWK